MQHLYVMKSSAGLLKVGIAGDVERRRKQIEAGGGHEIEVVATYGPFRRASQLECAIHVRLAEFRQKGEWFSAPTETILEAVEMERVCFMAAGIDSPTHPPGTDAFDSDEVLKQMAEQCARSVFAPALKVLEDLELVTQKYGELVDRYTERTDEFVEAVELVGWYGEQLKSVMDLARRAQERIKQLESENAALRTAAASSLH